MNEDWPKLDGAVSLTNGWPGPPANGPWMPVLHFYPTGNYVGCNQYWALGMACPHHKYEEEGGI